MTERPVDGVNHDDLRCARCSRRVEMGDAPYRAVCPTHGTISLHRTQTASAPRGLWARLRGVIGR